MLLLAALAAPMPAAEPPDFYAGFNDSTDAADAAGASIKPSWEKALQFVPGISGQAVFIGGGGKPDWKNSPGLQYPAQSLFKPTAGTVMFWVQPDWDGFANPLGINRLFQAGSGLNILMYTKLNTTLRTGASPQGGDATVLLSSPTKTAWLRGDWWHVALTWDSKGWVKQYVNGLPYATGYSYLRKLPVVKQPLDFGEITTMAVGSSFEGKSDSSIRANAAFDELKIFNRALSDDEIVADYRRFMPLDLVMERHFVRANQPEKLTLDIWPGGQMTRPLVGQLVPVPIKAKLSLTVSKEEGGATVTTLEKDIDLRERLSLEVPLANLTEGAYRLTCRISYGGGNYQKSFRFFAFVQQPAPAESWESVKLGEPLITIDCTKPDAVPLFDKETKVVESPLGSYREAAKDRDSRFAYELDLAAATPFTGQPMMLEVYWPDDRPRSMGLYLYRKSSTQQNRDRLSGGIQSGEEYASSGKMQVSRYLFYTWVDKYLFEARTMIVDYPAAVSKIVVRPVIGRLPKLAIQTPPGQTVRYFGVVDEDQTFEALLGIDNPETRGEQRVVKNVEMLLDYMDYTGQNILAHPYVRYSDAMYELPGTLEGYGNFLESALGARDLLLDMFQQRGKKCIAIIHPIVSHESRKMPHQQEALAASGYFLLDRNGKSVTRSFLKFQCANPLHPKFREELFGHFDEILRRFGRHPALAGLELWRGDWQFKDLDTGYDDLTVGTFEKETKLVVPVNSPETRFADRYAWLTGDHRKEWLAWRARKNTELLAELAARVHKVNPNLTFKVTIGIEPLKALRDKTTADDFDFAQYYYEEESLDIAALNKQPGLSLSLVRFPSNFRWQRHWNNTFSLADEIQADMKKQGTFRSENAVQVVSYLNYFESRKDSLKNDVYNSMFENADVKAHGRFFLKEMSESMGAMDPATILVGAQPIGTHGRDEESREFAQAFRSLPAGAFKDIAGLTDPVCGRSLSVTDGTYFYLQNRTPAEIGVDLQADTDKYRDLSSNEMIPPKDGVWKISLKPFELRAFKTDNKTAAIKFKAVQVPEAFKKQMEDIYKTNADAVKLLSDNGADTTAHDKLLKSFREALDTNSFGEAHRIAFSKFFRVLPRQMENAKRGYLKKQRAMLDAHRFAIDCGSGDFHETADGTLFFPDQKYIEGGYGYTGDNDVGKHSTERLQTKVDKTLMATQAFDVEGYAFTVPNGSYLVKLYNWIGYVPDGKPGTVVMTLSIQGKKVWDKMDLFLALKSDIRNALVSEFHNVVVADGVLRMNWSRVNKRYGWIDALEVIPESTPLEAPKAP